MAGAAPQGDVVRILQVNKYLYPKGGAETHMLALARGLERRGYHVRYFGMAGSANVTPAERTTTVREIDYARVGGWRERLGAFVDLVYNRRAGRAMGRLLRGFSADVAHLHNVYHQLSPSVIVALKRAGVPCVLTAHDYKLVCPSYWLTAHDEFCFDCRGHQYWNVVRNQCGRKGRGGDAALVVESYVHHFLRLYERHVDRVIAPSRYLRNRLVEGGFPAERIEVLHNALDVAAFAYEPAPGDYLLSISRLSFEKGVATLVEAARRVPEVPLWIAGDGPLRRKLEAQAAGLPNVRFLGVRPPQEVRRLLAGCRAMVLPSQGPENCPMSILEAFAAGKPVIASRVGGVPELFEGAEVGRLVPPRDPRALADAMCELWGDAALCEQMGTEARRHVERRHDLGRYVDRLEAIYGEVIGVGVTTGRRAASGREQVGGGAALPRNGDVADGLIARPARARSTEQHVAEVRQDQSDEPLVVGSAR